MEESVLFFIALFKMGQYNINMYYICDKFKD